MSKSREKRVSKFGRLAPDDMVSWHRLQASSLELKSTAATGTRGKLISETLQKPTTPRRAQQIPLVLGVTFPRPTSDCTAVGGSEHAQADLLETASRFSLLRLPSLEFLPPKILCGTAHPFQKHMKIKPTGMTLSQWRMESGG